MLWTVLAMAGGSYSALVADPAEVRFCVAAGEARYEQAVRTEGADSFAATMPQMVANAFRRQLTLIGGDDAKSLDTARRNLTGSAGDRERYDDCERLVGSAPADGTIVDAAQDLDSSASAASYEDEVAGAAAAAAQGEGVEGYPLLQALSTVRRHEVRCAVLANIAVEEAARGASDSSYGLTSEVAETLAGRLAERIAAEQKLREEDVRQIFKADFETFSAQIYSETDGNEAEGRAAFAGAIDECRPLYDSVEPSGDAGGTVSGLAPLAMNLDAEYANPAACWAILSNIALSMPRGSEGKAAFEAGAEQIAAVYAHGPKAGPDPMADLASARDSFDSARFDAFPEDVGGAHIDYCMTLAEMDSSLFH